MSELEKLIRLNSGALHDRYLRDQRAAEQDRKMIAELNISFDEMFEQFS